jgi:hypothetical protein
MAAGSTYTPIMTNTLSSSTSSVTLTSIPQTYTDLILVMNVVPPGSSSGGTFTFNGTSTGYSSTFFAGLETSANAISGRNTNLSADDWIISGAAMTDSSAMHLDIFHFQNYSNTTTYKTALQTENPGKFAYIGLWAHLWRNTAAITSITMNQPVNFLAGTTFTLYGIKAA